MKNKILSNELVNLIKTITQMPKDKGVLLGGLDQNNPIMNFTVISDEAQTACECEFRDSNIVLKLERKLTPFIFHASTVGSFPPKESAYIWLSKKSDTYEIAFMSDEHNDEVKEEVHKLISLL